jgi:large subunit ribosomal protein L15
MDKRKKNTRQRGQTTHGWGSMKKHRGSGNKGGVGNAGSGKRGDAKKPSFWKNKNYFGMRGFTSKSNKSKIISINISDLSKYTLKIGKNEINLGDFGISKLLGTGNVNESYKIIVNFASAKAIEKIEKAKGSVTLLDQSSKAQNNNTETNQELEESN